MFKGLPERRSRRPATTRSSSSARACPTASTVTAETARAARPSSWASQHKTHPVHGVQFHPESIASEHGHALLANFLDIAGLAPRRRNVRAARHAA